MGYAIGPFLEPAMHLKPNHPTAADAGRTLIGFNIINGREIEGDLGLIESRSAMDSRDVVGLFPDSGAKDVERAAKAAADAFGAWSRTPTTVRNEVLVRLTGILTAQQARLARVVTRETGLTLKESDAEVQEVIAACEALVKEDDPSWGPPRNGAHLLRRPLGVVGLLSSRTSPLAFPGRRLLGAIHSGNTVVWKPSDGAPTAAYLLLRALQEAGMPAGVVNTVNGKGRGGCGKHFLAGIEKGCFQLFCFAGSRELGRTVGEICGRSLIPADLEVGGRTPMLVMEDADLDLAVATALHGAYAAGGQRSTSLGNVLLHRPLAERFTERFVTAAAALKTGNPLKHPEVDFGPMQNQKLAEAFRNHWEKGRLDGAVLRCGGIQWTEDNRTAQVVGEMAKGAYMQPCVWTGVTPAMGLFGSDVYGPTVNLCEVESFESALDILNAGAQGLAAFLFTRDQERIAAFKAGTRTPALAINGPLGPAGLGSGAAWNRPCTVWEEHPNRIAAVAPAAQPQPDPVNWEALD